MCSITTEPVSARTCPKHRPRRTGPSGPKNITTPLHHIGKRGPMCKHLKGRSGLCRRFRLGREKRNRAAGLLNSFNGGSRSEEHTSELQSLMRISYAVFCLKKKTKNKTTHHAN